MNLNLYLQICFTALILFIKDSYTSDFQFISTTEKPTKPQEDVVKLCLAFAEIKLQGIVQQNKELLANVKNENQKLQGITKMIEEMVEKKLLKQIETNVIATIELKLQGIRNILEGIRGENNKSIQELERKIDGIESKIEDKGNAFKIQQQDEMLKNKKLFEQIETNILNKIEKNHKQLQQIEKKDVCTKEQAEIFRIGTSLEMKTQKIEIKLKKVLDNVKKITVPENCQDVLQLGYTSTGVFTIQPRKSNKRFEVLCNMDTREGGWTYIINRFDGSQDFYLGWEDYKNGFGSLSGEFWLGLQNIHEMTSGHLNNQLLIELVDWANVTKYALYDNFKLGDETEKYKIKSVGEYNGNASDYLVGHVNNPFLTKDKDSSDKTAANWKAAWWYLTSGSFYSHLTGHYKMMNESSYYGALQWGGFHGYNYSLKEARMMIKPKKL